MKTVFLETKNVAAFREALGVLEDVQAGQPGLGVVWGRAGRGKTVCAREYAVRTKAVYVRAQQDWSPLGLLGELCFELGIDAPRAVAKAKRLVCDVLEKRRRTVLVDEADRLKPDLIEHLRDIHDLVGSPVTLIGEEPLFPLLNSRRRLWSRVTQTVEFGPVTPQDIMLFAREAADLAVPPEAVKELQTRCDGDFRLAYRDVSSLERMARAARTNTVTLDMVKALPSPQMSAGGRHARA